LAAYLSGYGDDLWPAHFPCLAPDLWLTGDYSMDKLSAMGQPTRLT